MSHKLQNEMIDKLFDAILTLKDRKECYDFFMDVCTVNEIASLSQRYEVAGMLREAARHAFELGGAAFARHSDELQHVLVKGYRREGVSDVLLVESLEYEQRRGDFRRMHARGPCEAGGDDGAQLLDCQDDMQHLGCDEGLV